MSPRLTVEELRRALGGQVVNGKVGKQVLCPGPGHSAQDRSLSVAPADNEDGFICHSFGADDLIRCKEHVRARLGLPPFEPKPKRGNGASKPYSPSVAQYVYRTADGVPHLRVTRTAAKDFFQSHWDGEKWATGAPKGPKIPYRLPELIAAAPATPIYIPEGEKDCDNLAKLGFVATCNGGGADNGRGAKWTSDLNQYFKDRQVFILADNDDAGRRHAQHVACNLDPNAASVRVVELPGLPRGGDVSDWLVNDPSGLRLVRECQGSPLWEPALAQAADDSVVAELAKLPPLQAAQRLKESAEILGVGVGDLRKAVAEQRKQSRDDDDALPHWQAEPWTDEVPGADLLDSIKAEFEKYIVLPAGAGDALSLWVLHAWTMDAGDISPFMVLVSPTKRCGKTSVLIVLLYLTPRSELASNISASALFRYVEDVRPTLLIDEADSFLKDNEEMRGILNCGHTKAAAHVIRNVEVSGEHKPKRFSTWAPKAVATIRALADTLEDRAIVLQLQRKSRAAKVARLRKRDCSEFALIRRKAARWAADNFDALKDPDPKIPDVLNDRAADNWRPLLAIADLAGGNWPRRGREAACLLSGEGHESSSINVDLLGDIRKVFGDGDAIRSVDLVAGLNADPERPWVEWSRGKPLTPKQLGGLLSPFGITSETVSIAGLADAKGYKRTRFEEAWEVYLPAQNTFASQISPSLPSKRRNADGTGISSDFRSVAGGMGDGSKIDDLSHSRSRSDVSTAKKPLRGAEGHLEGHLTKSAAPLDVLPGVPAAPAEPATKASPTRAEPTPAPPPDPAPELARVATAKPENDGSIPAYLRRCAQCGGPSGERGAVVERDIGDVQHWLHEQCDLDF